MADPALLCQNRRGAQGGHGVADQASSVTLDDLSVFTAMLGRAHHGLNC